MDKSKLSWVELLKSSRLNFQKYSLGGWQLSPVKLLVSLVIIKTENKLFGCLFERSSRFEVSFSKENEKKTFTRSFIFKSL